MFDLAVKALQTRSIIMILKILLCIVYGEFEFYEEEFSSLSFWLLPLHSWLPAHFSSYHCAAL